MRINSFKNQKGITLIEIVAAVTIMGAAFVAVISLFSQSASTSIATTSKSDMMMIAQGFMEQALKSDTRATLNTYGTQTITGQIDNVVYGTKYHARKQVVLIQNSLDNTLPTLYRISITVSENSSFTNGVTLVSETQGQP